MQTVQGVVARRSRRRKPAAELPPPPPLFTESQWRQVSRAAGLTPRQAQVARLLCEGATYETIARRTGVSLNTVRLHVRMAFEKLGVHDRVRLLLELIAIHRRLTSQADPGEPAENFQQTYMDMRSDGMNGLAE
jgi:DNA-binding NarL/FixJ family response regulator